jgi:transcriptional regulator with XRE-family HTH domain
MPWGFFMSTIATRVTALRTAKQISQRELAKRCKISQPTIANIERGRTTEIKGFVLELLAKELGCTAAFILEGSDSSETHEFEMRLMELAALFKKLPEEDQESFLRVLRAMDHSPKIEQIEHRKKVKLIT